MRFLICASIAAVVAGSASGQIVRPAGKAKSATLNPMTGELRPGGNSERAQSLWSATLTFGYYTNPTLDGVNAAQLVDWGDTPAGVVSSFQIAYCAGGSELFDAQILFLKAENGRTPEQRDLLADFNLIGLPVGFEGCWIVTLDLGADAMLPFAMAGPDLDLDDGLPPNFSGVGLNGFRIFVWTSFALS